MIYIRISKYIMSKIIISETEIGDILDFIIPQHYIPKDVSHQIMNNNKKSLAVQLLGKEIYKEDLQKLKSILKSVYENTLISPGESVGIICAQSVGERNTQMTLSQFHYSGMANNTLTQCVPRLLELLNASLNPKNSITRIYFTKPHKTISELRETISNKLVELTLKNIADDIILNLDKEEESWYELFSVIYYDTFRKYKTAITIKVNIDILYEYKLTLEDIANQINTWSDMTCVWSPIIDRQNYLQLDIFIDTENIKLDEDRVLFINEDNMIEIYLEEVVLPILDKKLITGIKDIKSIFYSQDKNDDNNWFVETIGSNFREILSLDFINKDRTVCNNIWEILEILGIEATRQYLIDEFKVIMDGINDCHILLLVDRMTYSGSISSITRYTMRKDECGPFGKASFEESVDNFIKAGCSGDVENTNGVSASIICSKKIRAGTGMINVSLDIEHLPKDDCIINDKYHGNDKGEEREDNIILSDKVYERE